MALSFIGRTGYEAREGSAMIAARIARGEAQVGDYAARYGGRGHGWFVVCYQPTRDDPRGRPVWQRVAGPFTTREQAIAETEARR